MWRLWRVLTSRGGFGLHILLGWCTTTGGVYLLPEITAIIQVQLLASFYIPFGKDFDPPEVCSGACVRFVPGSEPHIHHFARTFAVIDVSSFKVVTMFSIKI